MITAKSDTRLWNAFVTGDDEAYVSIYQRYVADMFRYGMNITHDRETVKDCIHDVFTRLYKNRASMSAVENVKIYLFVALKNRIIDVIRRYVSFDFCGLEQIYSLSYNEKENTCDDEVIRNELAHALQNLSPRQREAIYHRYVEDFSFKEIAQLMNITAQSAQNLIQKGLLKLKESPAKSVLVDFFRM
jgi:RNA polymerase sigma factor (sigma-70 family)